MDVISYSETRAHLKDIMDRVVSDHAPVIVSRQKAEAVVMISLSDWNAIEESMHLLSTDANRNRLLSAINELNTNSGVEQTLIEP